MPKPTKEQLRKINKFSQTELTEDQVYVFRSLAVDTLPILQHGWFSDYYIRITESMLTKLKKDYKAGVGLLASHDRDRLPFGRTYDAVVQYDDVDGEQVKTLYVDHYMVLYVEGEDGKEPLMTEVGGMTTRDIANHIEVGHTFDTSIGFVIHDPKCSVCKNSLANWEKCEHIPGYEYEVNGEKVRCDVLVDDGEGIENSLVYAGAVNRATIQHGFSKNGGHEALRDGVKGGNKALYTVSEFKNLPMGAEVFCYLSKGNLEAFTLSPERRNYKEYCEDKERVAMSAQDKTALATGALSEQSEGASVTEPEVSAAVEEPQVEAQTQSAELSSGNGAMKFTRENFDKLAGQVEQLTAQVNELRQQAELVEAYRADLVSETVKAAVAARGNTFNAERYEKYLKTLSISEVKEELAAMRQEFSSPFATVRLTSEEADTGRNEGSVEMTEADLRNEAARIALERHRNSGGNLAELTKQAYAELKGK